MLLSSGPEPKVVGGGHVHSGPDGHLSLHTKFELSRTILAIPTYLYRKMLHLPMALNPKYTGDQVNPEFFYVELDIDFFSLSNVELSS